jgi:hypothetical protein
MLANISKKNVKNDHINMDFINSPLTDYFKQNKLKHELTYLLPYDCSTKNKINLEIGLNEYQLLLNLLEMAIIEYNNKNLHKFDPNAGENACQIRAVKIALFSQNNLVDFSRIENQLKKIKKNIEKLLLSKNIEYLMKSKIFLKDLLIKENLIVNLTPNELYLLKSFILTLTKISQPSEKLFYIQKKIFLEKEGLNLENNIFSDLQSEKADPTILKKYGNVSSKFTDKLFRRIRKHLSQESIEFLKKIALETDDNSLKTYLNDSFIIKHLNTSCLPMFWSYKALFHKLEKENISIILHAKFIDKNKNTFEIENEEYLLFENKNDSKTHSFTKKIENISDIKKPKVVIQGIVYNNFTQDFKVSWNNFIEKAFLKHIILAGAADHRQYPNESFDELIHSLNDREYINYKKIANKQGYSLKNPSTFFIQHVYAF